MLRGRIFTAEEVAGRAPVVVISETVARDFFPGEDPIGRSVGRLLQDSQRVVIGVVADAITARLRELAYASIDYPLESPLAAKMLVRAAGPAEAVIPSLRSVLHPVDSRVRLAIAPVNEGLQRELAEPRTLASIATVLAGIALTLALIGIYGVTCFIVAQRRQEIGVRVACGASSRDVLLLLVRDSLRPIGIGLALGLLVAVGASRLFAGVLYGLDATDPLAFAGAIGVLLPAAVPGVIVPATRAASAEPVSVLREL